MEGRSWWEGGGGAVGSVGCEAFEGSIDGGGGQYGKAGVGGRDGEIGM